MSSFADSFKTLYDIPAQTKAPIPPSEKKEFIELILNMIKKKSSETLLSMVNHNEFFDFIEQHLHSLNSDELFLVAHKMEHFWDWDHVESKLFFSFKQFEFSKKEDCFC